MDTVIKAKNIINKIRYITLATVSEQAQPWGTPVLAAFDDDYNFYWTSMVETRHSQNIRINPAIYFTIFDSTVAPGENEAVYVQATASELSDSSEIEKAATLVYGRKNKAVPMAKDFMGDSPKRLYKATPEKVWVKVGIEEKTEITL